MKSALILAILFVAVSCQDPNVSPVCPNDNGLPYVNCKDCSKYAVQPQQIHDSSMTPCELEALVHQLTYPDEGYQLHAAALRNELRKLIDQDAEAAYDTLQQLDEDGNTYDNEGLNEDKRSLSSLVRDGALRGGGKRNVGALARSGLLRKEQYDSIKRSIATLAKNGQLPSREPDTEMPGPNEEKRYIGSLVRAGGLGGKRNLASLARQGYGKRNLASLVRTGAYVPKRNMASLARSNMWPSYKRNVGALARDWSLPVHSKVSDKRNIQSLKNSMQGRRKRDLGYSEYTNANNPEVDEPVYQSSPVDYEELFQVLNGENSPNYNNYNVHADEKRFLGSVARNGLHFRPTYQKRHIGTLARMGMLRSNDYNTYGDMKTLASTSYRQQQQDKRHIGALARPDSTTHTSNFASQSAPVVDDATTASLAQLAGAHQAYNPHGAPHHPESPPYANFVTPAQVFDILNEFNRYNNNNRAPNPYDAVVNSLSDLDENEAFSDDDDDDDESFACHYRLLNLLPRLVEKIYD